MRLIGEGVIDVEMQYISDKVFHKKEDLNGIMNCLDS